MSNSFKKNEQLKTVSEDAFSKSWVSNTAVGLAFTLMSVAIYKDISTIAQIQYDLDNPKVDVISSTAFNRYCFGVLANRPQASSPSMHKLCIDPPKRISRTSFYQACQGMPSTSSAPLITEIMKLCIINDTFLKNQGINTEKTIGLIVN